MTAEHRRFLEDRDIRGRIYISEQGINAQYGGLRTDAVAYAEWLAATQPLFAGLRYSVWPAEEHAFPRLRLKYRPNLISLAGGMGSLPLTQPQARAREVPPEEWQRMLRVATGKEERTESESGRGNGAETTTPLKPVVLDVRNSYEWDAGHFEGAVRPLEVGPVSSVHELPVFLTFFEVASSCTGFCVK
jgi:predicted sulfurtransferase